ncbi:MAG: tetratricopeptide repeat protein [Candidatus Atabeyarchaeum deiterrae]
MVGIEYCPVIGGKCSKTVAMKLEKDTFFLAEAFNPDEDRKRREFAITNVLMEEFKSGFHEGSLKIADKDPSNPSFFCDICRMIQCSAYGIADISGLNPNVMLELGMMLALGKPVFVLVRRGEEENLGTILPSDIAGRRVVPYKEYIDIQKDFAKHLQNRPQIEPLPIPAEEARKTLADIAPNALIAVDKKIQEMQKNLQALIERTELMGVVTSKSEVKVPASLEKQIGEVNEKLERMETLLGQPQDSKSAFYRGNWYSNRKAYEKAIQSYDWALTLKPDAYQVWNNKGNALINLGRPEEAIKCFDKAIQLKQDAYLVWNNKGAALGKLGKNEEALEYFDKAIQLKQDYENVWNNKGAVLIDLGRPEEAIKCFDKAIELKSDDEEAWSNKGVALGKLGKNEEALEYFDKAIQLKLDCIGAWVNKGASLVKLGRLDEARSCFEKSLKIDPSDITALTDLSEALLILGEPKEGLEVAEKALTLAKEPEDIVVLRFLCVSACFLKGENERVQEKQEELTVYLKGLREGFKVARWDFSDLLPTIQKLDTEDREKLLSLMSLLKGEINVTEFEQKTRNQ